MSKSKALWVASVALIALAMGGCDPTIPADPNSSICVSAAFSVAETDDIVSAAHEWRDRSSGAASLMLHRGESGCDTQLDRDANLIVGGWLACGDTKIDGSLIRLNPSCNKLRASALHEFGHLLGGLSHSNEPADIMYWISPTNGHLTDADVEYFLNNNPYL